MIVNKKIITKVLTLKPSKFCGSITATVKCDGKISSYNSIEIMKVSFQKTCDVYKYIHLSTIERQYLIVSTYYQSK